MSSLRDDILFNEYSAELHIKANDPQNVLRFLQRYRHLGDIFQSHLDLFLHMPPDMFKRNEQYRLTKVIKDIRDDMTRYDLIRENIIDGINDIEENPTLPGSEFARNLYVNLRGHGWFQQYWEDVRHHANDLTRILRYEQRLRNMRTGA